MKRLIKNDDLKALILVTARKNSKRIKNKNITKIKGKITLIDLTFDFIKKNLLKYDTMVSTDSNIIKKKAKNYKFLSPWLRPKRLSTDKAKSINVIIHAIKWYEKNFKKIDFVILLQPTSPFRRIKDINSAIDLYKKKNTKNKLISVVSCKKSVLFPPIFKKKNDGSILKIKESFINPNGSFYIINRDKIINYKKIYGSNTFATIVNGDKFNLDINDYYDLKKVKKYYN